MNFGFHPDRDEGGTHVSCEYHADSGGYHETNVALGVNYRKTFNTFTIKLRKGSITWMVNGKSVHEASAVLTEPMTTRLILRTNFKHMDPPGDPGFLPAASFEISHFKFTPAE